MLNKFKQFCVGSIVTVSCLTLGWLPASAQKTVIYDFTKPEANVLKGKVEARYTVDGIPLDIKIGITNFKGNFLLGEKGTNLWIEDSLADLYDDPTDLYDEYRGGLGINSECDGGSESQINGYCMIWEHQPYNDKYYSEAAVFNFDPKFKAKKIYLGNMVIYEDLTIFADGEFFMNFISPEDTRYPSFKLTDNAFSSLMMTTFGFRDTESDYYISAIEGTIESVPEPALTLGLITVAGLGFLKRRHTNV